MHNDNYPVNEFLRRYFAGKTNIIWDVFGTIEKEVTKNLPDAVVTIEHNNSVESVVLFQGIERTDNITDYINDIESKLKENTEVIIFVPYGNYEDVSLNKHSLDRHDIRDLFKGKKDLIWDSISWRMTKNNNITGWYKIMYRVDHNIKAGTINYDRKLFLQNPRETVALCMISNNAEGMLHRALKSASKVCDELIICDTGSTDGTIEIAKKYTDKVYSIDNIKYKERGFCDIRNETLKYVTSDWVLWIDSDEEIVNTHNFHKYVRPNGLNGYSITQHHFTCEPPGAFKPDYPVRLFRSNKGIKWFGKIHEHPEIELNKSVGCSIILPDVHIAHDGYFTEEVRRRRFDRNIEFMKWDREFYPDRMLGKFLWIRDLMHLTRYELEHNGKVLNDKIVGYCNEAITMYRDNFMDFYSPATEDGLGYYTEALRVLNKGFEVKLAIDANNGHQVMPRDYRFENTEDLTRYVKMKGKLLEGNNN